jgi:hypothetical protein
MKKISPGALAALLVAALLATPAYAGPTVTVRVEGQSATLLERRQVTLPDTDTLACGSGGNWTVADALELATGGGWDRQPLVQTILGESHSFTDNDYWALWNGGPSGYTYGMLGICEQVMSAGREALLLVDRTPPPSFASTSFPLALRGLPTAVQASKPVLVSVVVFAPDGTAAPVAGATVSGGGATATTAADGTATLTFPRPGEAVVKASKPGIVPSAGERVRVSATPVAIVPAVPDRIAPLVIFSRLPYGKVFRRKRAPRELAGRVTPDPSGLEEVRLSIMRRVNRRCWLFDGSTERFKRRRCGAWHSFAIGDRADWSYLLPRRLRKGRYAIRAVAVDKAGNDSITKTVIHVR